ncbi:MAG: FAD-dependent oxidoreductase [Ruminococcaceae bacterium]|nr:FAD-dependent oxidoreductase [Oscillospiraceae bacterium]
MKHNKYPHIFSPITIGNTVFRNRIFTAPATPHLLQTDEQYPTEAVIAYYAEKAKGGSACVCIGGHNMDKDAPPDPGHTNLNIRVPTTHRYWSQLTDRIHMYGAKASLELLAFEYHAEVDGQLCYVSPSGDYGPMITKEQMEAIAEDHADCAEAAVKCGFDSIFIHGGHGLFLFRMLSPLFNKRTDEFGGSMENRARFANMILDAIRRRVGNKILIEWRVSGDELAPAGYNGFKVEDCIEFLKLIEDKIDIAHVSAGNMSIAGTEGIMHPTIFLKPGCNAYLAAQVKAAGIKVPVLTLGAFQTPELMEKALADGGADIISMARGTIADPEAVFKARDGIEDEIIPCIKCFHCLEYSTAPRFACSVNPTVGREAELKTVLEPPVRKKKVVVIGGGPAGMQAAVTAAKRGHQVILMERDTELGGKLKCAAAADFKYDLNNFMNYLRRMVEKNDIEVRLGKDATPEIVAAEQADVVIAALGADASRPPVPGIEKAIAAEEIYHMDADALGKTAVIIGGGDIGCETALYLAQKGVRVVIVEMLRALCPETFSLTRYAMLNLLAETRLASAYMGASCAEVTDTGVVVRDSYGMTQEVDADMVILAAGMKPRNAAAESFRQCAPEFFAVGDCVTAKNVRTATRTAFDAASVI